MGNLLHRFVQLLNTPLMRGALDAAALLSEARRRHASGDEQTDSQAASDHYPVSVSG
jgi:hypothetical protein